MNPRVTDPGKREWDSNEDLPAIDCGTQPAVAGYGFRIPDSGFQMNPRVTDPGKRE